MPKVSVVIPTYNRADYIVQSINSVLNQTFTDFEIIVVDDGSTDNTEILIREQFKDKVIYLSKPNGGQGSARNLGVSAAKGEYIAFLDSDDLWLPEKLEIQTGFMDAHPEVDLSSTWAMTFMEYETGEIEDLRLVKCSEAPTIRRLLTVNSVTSLTAMIKKNCLESLGGFDEDQSMIGIEDYELWIRVASKYKIAHIPRVLAKYRVHDNNIFYGRSIREIAQADFAVLNRIDEKMPGLIASIFGSKKALFANRYRTYGDKISFDGDVYQKLEFYRNSVKCGKTDVRIALKIIYCTAVIMKRFITGSQGK